MVHPWIKAYILLALRIDKACRHLDEWPLVDHFYGPSALRAVIAGEPERALDDLGGEATALADSLPSQGFERQRAAYLAANVRALEAVCRKLSGQDIPLQEEIRHCLDIRPIWKPEAEFEQALALLEEALPGSGDLRGRHLAMLRQTEWLADRPEAVLPLVQEVLAEARRRTRRLVALPEGENVDLRAVRDRPYGAANWYLGRYRSRIELNVDRPIHPFGLLYQMCHEVYPGHHTEFALKERTLHRARGYAEQSIFIQGPQLVVAEGMASVALEMIFNPAEFAGWMDAFLRSELGMEGTDLDLAKLFRALVSNLPDELGGNLVMMLRNGRSDEEMLDYAMAYTPHPQALIREMLSSLKSPLRQIYAFSYYHGRRLMEPLLAGPDRAQVFRRLLTEQVYPSLLTEWAAGQNL